MQDSELRDELWREVWLCATCAVEHAEPGETCRICSDERQYVPVSGQAWTTPARLSAAGHRIEITELEPGLHGLVTQPKVGIGQQAKLIRTPDGNVLWDPLGHIDAAAVGEIRALGPVVAIVASHPHMFGVQSAWSRALDDAPVLVAEADAEWVARPDPAIRTWSGSLEVVAGLTLSQPGGHFPGSTVAHWAAGADGRGVLLSGDTIFPNPDRTSVGFLRSYPNRIPLSPAVVERIAAHVERYAFDRIYGNFDNVIPSDGRAVVRRSADRYVAWVRGDYDHLT